MEAMRLEHRSRTRRRIGLGIVLVVVASNAFPLACDAERPKRVAHEVTNTLPVLKAWEEMTWNRHGHFVFSEDDADSIRFEVVSWERCEGRVRGRRLQDATYEQLTPVGCLWEYLVIPDRCDDTCSWDGLGNPCGDKGRCFCAIARPANDLTTGRFCIDDAGNQFSTHRGRVPPGWQTPPRTGCFGDS